MDLGDCNHGRQAGSHSQFQPNPAKGNATSNTRAAYECQDPEFVEIVILDNTDDDSEPEESEEESEKFEATT